MINEHLLCRDLLLLLEEGMFRLEQGFLDYLLLDTRTSQLGIDLLIIFQF